MSFAPKEGTLHSDFVQLTHTHAVFNREVNFTLTKNIKNHQKSIKNSLLRKGNYDKALHYDLRKVLLTYKS